MARYIDADAVMEVLERSAKDPRNETAMTSWANAFQELIDLLDDTLIPIATVDVVKVVRCKDCKYSHYFVNAHTDNYGTLVKAKVYCNIWRDWVPPEGYCFSADMRGEEDEIQGKK